MQPDAAAPVSEPSQASAPPEKAEGQRLVGDSNAQSRRILEAKPSDESSGMGTAELIAQSCKEAFDQGMWSSQDPLNSKTALFWVTRYKDHVLTDFQESKSEAEEYLKNMDPHSSLLIRFVVRSLLRPKKEMAFAGAIPFAKAFAEMNQSLPGLGPAMGRDCRAQ